MNAGELNESGNACFDAGDFARAQEYYRQSIAADPRFAEAHNNLGQALRRQGMLSAAQAALENAIRLDPALAIAHYNLGGVLQESGQSAGALAQYTKALDIYPEFEKARLDMARLLILQGNPPGARSVLSQGLQLEPAAANFHFYLGNLDADAGDLDTARGSYEQALGSQPDHTEAELGLARVLMRQGQWPLARELFRRACERGGPHEAYLSYAICCLILGDYADGWKFMERRLDSPAPELQFMRKHISRMSRKPFWDGEPLAGRRLLVWNEQGLGDTLMMLRYLPLLHGRGAGRVLSFCEAPMKRLIRAIPGVDEIISTTQIPDVAKFDCHCSIMSLPYLFGTEVQSIPRNVPYLVAADERRAFWRERMRDLQGLRVGLTWAGRRENKLSQFRTIPFALLEPLLRVPGVAFVSLQKDRTGQPPLPAHVADWMDECNDLMETAALVSNLDLVICIDTGVAHLAGGLGKPVWLLCYAGSDWRWMLERTDSPWYPGMRIYRQPAAGEWQEPVARVAADLSRLAGAK
jgi:Tfp pilus assembly protein PilF